MQIEIPEHKNH